MFVASRKHKPRYKGIMRIKSLEYQIDELKYMAKKLLKQNELYHCKVEDIEFDVDDAIEDIRGDPNMKRKAITKYFTDILNRIAYQKKELTSVKTEQLEQQRMEEVKAQLQAEADKFVGQGSKVQNFFMKKRFGSLKKKTNKTNMRRGSLKKSLAFSRSCPNLANLSDAEEEEDEEDEEDVGSGSDGESVKDIHSSRTSCHEIKLQSVLSNP